MTHKLSNNARLKTVARVPGTKMVSATYRDEVTGEFETLFIYDSYIGNYPQHDLKRFSYAAACNLADLTETRNDPDTDPNHVDIGDGFTIERNPNSGISMLYYHGVPCGMANNPEDERNMIAHLDVVKSIAAAMMPPDNAAYNNEDYEDDENTVDELSGACCCDNCGKRINVRINISPDPKFRN